MAELTIGTMNCRGMSDVRKRRDVMNFLRNGDYDILFLQDTHLTKNSLQYFNNLWKGKSYHSCHTNRSRGVAIMIKQTLQHELVQVHHADCGNFILVTCSIGTQTYLLVNIYGPNEDNPNFYHSLKSLLQTFRTDHTIIGGDFNFVMNANVDSFNYAREYNTNAKRIFVNFINDNDLVDIWRVRNPNKLEYTWSRNNPLKCGRLDMLFINDDLTSSVRDITIKPGYRTDHSLVVMKIQVMEAEKGPGIWKFNESVLQDVEYINTVKSTLRDIVYQYAIPVYDEEYATDENNFHSVQFTIDDCLFYETLIMLIRGETVKYCKRKARKRRAKEKELTNNIHRAQEVFNTNKNELNAQLINAAKEKLEVHRKPYIEGLIIRSRTQWHEEGEKSSKYFLSLEKRNIARKTIQYLQNDGKTIMKSAEILSVFTKTFQDKYSARNEIEPNINFIKNNISETLTEAEKDTLEAEITLQELTTALQCMKKGKSPGSNGFSVDFFRCFWKQIGIFLYRAVTLSFSRKEVLTTHKESIITLIPKAGRSTHSLKGWRPISLLNVDYKIVSTAVANRFKTVINRIINASQSAYIQGRYIGENSRLVYDVISHVNQTHSSGVIMAADFEAAFETVSWAYVRTVLRELNFGNNFIDIINIMYFNKHNFSRILMKGFLGEKIYMNRGIRQGDPVSGYLFNIAVLMLAKQITNSNKLKGIHLSADTEVRISQYADDTILFLDSCERSLLGATEELSKFSAQSGLRLNWEKTSCMFLGAGNPQQSSNAVVNKIKWVNEIKILGIYFKYNISNITEINLERRLELLDKEIRQWKRRYITPLGKITVIKSLLLSKLVHIFTALPNPSAVYIKKIEHMLYGFLWNNKPDRIRRTKIIQKLEFDGLQMVDLTSFINSLKMSWLKRLAYSEAVWTTVAKSEQLDPMQLLSYSTAKLKEVKRHIRNIFWREVVDSLIAFNQLVYVGPEDIIREPLWFSEYTKFRKSIVRRWDNQGLRFIGDLLNPENGNILTREEIKQQYRISMTFLCYESLVRSLPQQVRNATRMLFERPNIPFKLQLFLSKPNISRYCYALFVNALRKKCVVTDNNLKQKWNRDIGGHHVGSLINVKTSTKSAYLQYLHYRIINRILPTNKFLNAVQLSTTNTCTFCKQEIETIMHLFWQCPITQSFLATIDTELYNRYNTRVNYGVESWFFPQETNQLTTLINIVAKAVIFKARNEGRKPEIAHVLNSLKIEAQKEQLASRMNNKQDVFKNKWKALRNILS